MANLFSQYKIANLELKNRIAMAPMCMFCAKDDGKVTDFHVLHYGTRAVGGVGLIMVEATAVSPEGRISSNDLGIWDDAHIEGLKRLVQTAHENDAKIGIQIGHAGRKCRAEGMVIEAPSAIAFDEESLVPAEMTKEDIAATVEEFKQAALRADQAGFDIIQIHAAHGYLLSEFLSPLTNTRTDEYGGSPEKRARILAEVIEAVRSVWKNKPLEIRVSAEDYQEGGNQAEDLALIINLVKDRGVDAVNVSTGGVVSVMPKAFPGYQIPHAKLIREKTGLPVVAGGLILTAEEANRLIESGEVEQVYFGRELLRNPYLALNAAFEMKAETEVPKQYKRAYL